MSPEAGNMETVSENRTDRDSPYMDAAEAASYLKIKEKQLMELARRGQIPRAKVGRLVRFHRGDLDAWMKKGGTQCRSRK